VIVAMADNIGIRHLEEYMGRDLLCIIETAEEVRSYNKIECNLMKKSELKG
jgi:hypothetical protein